MCHHCKRFNYQVKERTRFLREGKDWNPSNRTSRQKLRELFPKQTVCTKHKSLMLKASERRAR